LLDERANRLCRDISSAAMARRSVGEIRVLHNRNADISACVSLLHMAGLPPDQLALMVQPVGRRVAKSSLQPKARYAIGGRACAISSCRLR
jgi:hypothetical protein